MDFRSFDNKNVFAERSEGPIAEPTHLVFDHKTGENIFANGADFFYLPHGLTVDHEDNMWFTDVGTHQVQYPAAEIFGLPCCNVFCT